MGQMLTPRLINCHHGEWAYENILPSIPIIEWERRITREKTSKVGAVEQKTYIDLQHLSFETKLCGNSSGQLVILLVELLFYLLCQQYPF